MKIQLISIIALITSVLHHQLDIKKAFESMSHMYLRQLLHNSLPQLQLSSTSQVTSSSSTPSPNGIEDDLLNFIQTLLPMMINMMRSFLGEESNPAVDKCYDRIKTAINDQDMSLLFNMVSSSGKGVSDFGSEKECLRYNLKYFKLVYSQKTGPKNLDHEEDWEVIAFLSQKDFITGVCLVPECFDLIQDIMNTSNKEINDFFINTLNFHNKSLVYIDTDERNEGSKGLAMSIIMWCIIAYFAFKLIMSIVKIIFYSSYNIQIDEGYDKNEKRGTETEAVVVVGIEKSLSNEKSININENEGKDDNNKSGEDKLPQVNERKSNRDKDKEKNREYIKTEVIFKKQSMSSEPELDIKKLKYLGFISFFDFFDNIRLLSEEKNNYYDDENITIFSFIHFIILFLLTFNSNFTTLILIPGREFLNNDFYDTVLFFIIKFSSFSSVFWFIIEAATFGFKFMSSIKRELLKTNSSSISFFFILKWWCTTIPKIFMFYLIFYLLHVYMDQFNYLLNTSTMFQYYLQVIEKEKTCKANSWMTLIPFYLPYNDSSRHFEHCYKFVYYSLNQFYCFIFMTLFIYIAYKIKSRIIDYTIFGLWVVNVLLSYLFFLNINEDYLIQDVLGQNITEKKTHLAFNYYMIGIWLGFSVFYYYDFVSNNSIVHSNQYVPFHYCYTVLKFIDTFKLAIKNVLIGFFCLLCLLFSLSYNFICYTQRDNNRPDQLLFKANVFTNILDCYEKIIMSICLCFLILLILSQAKDCAMRFVIESNLFIPFARISTSFFYVVETGIYLVYCLFLLQLKLSYPNLIYYSIGLLMVISLLSFLLTVMFEMPMRIFIKFIMKKCFPKEDKKEIRVAAELTKMMGSS